MSLPVPSAYSAQLLLTLWLGFLFVVILGYGLVRWWEVHKKKSRPNPPVRKGAATKQRGARQRKR